MADPAQNAQQQGNPQGQNVQPQAFPILEDYNENEQHLGDTLNAQNSMEDKLWYALEYRVKNYNLDAGKEYPEDLRERYGFNQSGEAGENDAEIQEGLRETISETFASATVEDFKKFFRAMGSMKARAGVIGGKYYDVIEKAIGDNDPHRDLKTSYLYNHSGFHNKPLVIMDYTAETGNKVESSHLNGFLGRKYDDYKNVTFQQFAADMGIDYNKMNKGQPADLDNVYAYCKRIHPTHNELQLKNDVYSTLAMAFSLHYTDEGMAAERESFTDEQRRLFRQGQKAFSKPEEMDLSQINDWANREGEQTGTDLHAAAGIHMMKESRRVTQLSGSFGYRSEGCLDSWTRNIEAQTRFVGDIVNKKKEIEQVKDSVVKKANKRFYEDSVRRYPKQTPGQTGFERYVILHTGSKAGKTPDEMVNNLAKTLAACSLREQNRPFNVKEIRTIAAYYKDLFALDRLKSQPEALKSALQDSSTVLRMGRDLKKGYYGVPANKQDQFCSDMQKLKDHLLPMAKRSKEYQKFYNAVKAAAELNETLAGKSPEEREGAFCTANLKVFEMASKYMDGKEIFRFKDNGKISFDHALDAMAICSKASPNLTVRTDKIIGNINRIRNHNNRESFDYIDAEHFHEHYGADHSARTAADYSGPKAAAHPEVGINLPLHNLQPPAVPAEPRFVKTDDIPKTPEVPRLPQM